MTTIISMVWATYSLEFKFCLKGMLLYADNLNGCTKRSWILLKEFVGSAKVASTMNELGFHLVPFTEGGEWHYV